MRCPKCQYLGFEPSPRCKNCGYDFSLSGDDLMSITMVHEPEDRGAMADFDLQIVPEVSPQVDAPQWSGGFDLDDLLARGRSGEPAASPAAVARVVATAVMTPPQEDVLRIVQESQTSSVRTAEPDPASPFVAAMSAAMAGKPEPQPVPVVMRIEVLPPPGPPSVAPAEPVAARRDMPPVPPRKLSRIIDIEPVAGKTPVVRVVPSAPVTTELPLFMQGMSTPSVPTASARAAVPDAPRAGMPLTIEAATDADVIEVAPEAVIEVVEEIDDRPLVEVPTVLRQPLAVRRTTPDPARLRAKYGKPAKPASTSGDLLQGIDELDANLNTRSTSAVSPANRLSAEPTPQSLPAGWLQGVSVGKRVSAAALDVLLLGALNIGIVWFTLVVCGMTPSQVRLLPLIPIALFFLLVDGGYLVLFTAACGQTIGKMAAGIRVVGTTTGAVINDRITVGQAIMRSIGTIASCVPLGAGLWMSLFGDGRAFHDRIAHTRVVRA